MNQIRSINNVFKLLCYSNKQTCFPKNSMFKSFLNLPRSIQRGDTVIPLNSYFCQNLAFQASRPVLEKKIDHDSGVTFALVFSTFHRQKNLKSLAVLVKGGCPKLLSVLSLESPIKIPEHQRKLFCNYLTKKRS